MNRIILTALLFVSLLAVAHSAPAKPPRPNVLFIAIDDQNDWIGHLGGHPLAKTPHIDRLAARGTTFLNAHVNAPLCNPSRTSLMLSLRPTTTGVYGLAPWFRDLAPWKDRVALPQHFKAHGYRTYTCGKVYHGGAGGPAKRALEFDVWGSAGGIGVKPERKLIPPTPMGDHPLMDWGVFPHRDEDKGDYRVASWTISDSRDAGRRAVLSCSRILFAARALLCYAAMVRPLSRRRQRAAPGQGRRPWRHAAVLLVPALGIARTAAQVGPGK